MIYPFFMADAADLVDLALHASEQSDASHESAQTEQEQRDGGESEVVKADENEDDASKDAVDHAAESIH